MVFSPGQMASLRGIVEGLLPSIPCPEEYADDADLRRYFEIRLSRNDEFINTLVETIENKLSESESAETKALLSALSTTVGSSLIFTQLTMSPFSDWDADSQACALNGLRESQFSLRRKIFTGLKKLICFLAFSFVSEREKYLNPMWSALQYPGPLLAKEKIDQNKCFVSKSTISHDDSDLLLENLIFDCIIVGSGAGGSVAAANLSAAGYSVLIIEKGSEPIIDHLEVNSFETMYEKSGLLSSSDGNIGILAASVLGGGPTINWSCCIETPKHVRTEWVESLGLVEFRKNGEFDESMERILSRISGKADHVVHNVSNKILIEGAKSMGLSYEATKQNLNDCATDRAGYICFGDDSGNKQNMLITFLEDATRNGAKILTNAKVHKICYEDKGKKKAKGVHVEFETGKVATLFAKRCVVIAAGSLNTPCLLQRSGFTNPNIGKNLHLHPVCGVYGIFSKDVNCYLGAPMTTACKEFALGPKKNGYGAFLECPSVHSGLGASSFNWKAPESYRKSLLKLKNTSSIIVLQRDNGGGEVVADQDGKPIIHYKVCKEDEASMLEGLAAAVEMLVHAGANEVHLGGVDGSCIKFDEKESINDRLKSKDFHHFLREIGNLRLYNPEVNLFSAHQMGTCRLSTCPKNGGCDENGELWECSDLYISDASLFPTASGANPMCTTLAISHMLSNRLVDRLLFEDSMLDDAALVEKTKKLMILRNARRQ